MDVHPRKNGINRYWSIPTSKFRMYDSRGFDHKSRSMIRDLWPGVDASSFFLSPMIEFALHLSQKDLTTLPWDWNSKHRLKSRNGLGLPTDHNICNIAVSTNLVQRTATGNAHNLLYNCIYSMPSTKGYKWLHAVSDLNFWYTLAIPSSKLT